MKKCSWPLIIACFLLFGKQVYGQWVKTNGPCSGDIRTFVVSGSAIFAGTSMNGVFRSTNNGTTWSKVNSGLTDTHIQSLAAGDSTLFAGTWGGGVWQRPLSEMTGRANAHPRRKIGNHIHFKIAPLNRTGAVIAVEFTLPHSDRVAITMYDLAGRERASLVNKRFAAGSYRFLWDTHAISRGCYAARLQTGSTTNIKLVQIAH